MIIIITVLALVITVIYFLYEEYKEKNDEWRGSAQSVKKKKIVVEKDGKTEVKVIRKDDVQVIRKAGKTVYSKNSSSSPGVVILHDNGKITVSMRFEHLIHGLKYRKYGNYYSIKNPTSKDKQIILDRLYS